MPGTSGPAPAPRRRGSTRAARPTRPAPALVVFLAALLTVLLCGALGLGAEPATAATQGKADAAADTAVEVAAPPSAPTGVNADVPADATPAVPPDSIEVPMPLRPLTYTVRFPAPETHRVEVEAVIPTEGRSEIELMMAVWTPGSYLVREYARQVETLSVSDGEGRPLAVEKSRKNRWRVETGAADGVLDDVVVRYRLYCRELSVRTNFVDAGFALLNGAPTFLTRVDDGLPADAQHRVRLELPPGWRRAIAALPEEDGAFVAADFDVLVDSPIYAGSPRVQQFEVGPDFPGATEDGHFAVDTPSQVLLVHDGGDEVWDYERSLEDVRAIVTAQAELWGGLPFERYVFFNLVAEAGGGLEHVDSTVLLTSRWKARTEEGWRDWLGLVSHELFHAWNVKRMHPESLGRFDYEAENHTESLWFVEGVTSYYDDLLVRRAGLMTDEEYLARLGKVIESVQTTPGRLVQPLDEASYDAWIKYYRRDENTVNRDVSYYRKGALVAWLLDARIRQATDGEASLDDLMRAAWARWGGSVPGAKRTGYTPEGLLDLVADVADDATADWLAATLSEARELDYTPALEVFGLELVTEEEAGATAVAESVDDPEPEPATGPESEKPPDEEDAPGDGTPEVAEPETAGGGGSEREETCRDETAGWLGAQTKVNEGRLLVSGVPRDTPAFAAGVNVGDEILALDGYRVPPDGLDERLKAYRPDTEVELLVARREKLTRLPVTLTAEPEKAFYPRSAADAGEAARRQRGEWLGSND